MKTAKEFLLEQEGYSDIDLDFPKLSKAIEESLIEFAKLHVREALKKAVQQVKLS